MRDVIIDTDPGIDDAAAILFALRSPELRVHALTTVFGNVEVEQATINALRILEVAGRDDIPVYMGASQPLLRQPRLAKHIHGDDGLGNAALPLPRRSPASGRAAETIVRLVMAADRPTTILALGPPTNVALAYLLEPRIAERVDEVICMGGAVFVMGNASPVASANFVNDPEAAAVLYGSGLPITQVGLDVCEHVYITHEQFALFGRSHDSCARFLWRITPFHAQAEARLSQQAIRYTKYGAGPWHHYNDVPAVGYAVAPHLYTTERLFVAIETRGEYTSGETVADFRSLFGRTPNVTVCLGVQAEEVVRLFIDRILGEPHVRSL